MNNTHSDRSKILGSMHTTVSVLMCSRSNSSLVRTSSRRTLKFARLLYSINVFGNSDVVTGTSVPLSDEGVDGGRTGDLDEDERSESPDGLRGTVGESGDRLGVGEAGRLLKVSIVGGIGVLEGRGPGSMGSAGKRGGRNGDLPALDPVGTDGSLRPSCSSSSSMEGNDAANSVRVMCDVRGEEPVDEEGEGGPKLEVGTRACGDGAAALAKVGDARVAKLGGEGRFCREIRCGLGIGTSGGTTVWGGEITSRERRLLVDTASPPFCSERIRSAMVDPTGRPEPSVSFSLLADDLEM